MWVTRAQHDNPFSFTVDSFNGAPEGEPRSTATVFANFGLQTGFVWGFGDILGDVGAFNLFMALGLIGSATAMFLLLRALGCTVVASIFGAYAFGFGPYALERAYAGHLGLLQNWVLVLVVAAMIRMGGRRTLASGALAGAAIGLAFWVTAYQGLFASLIAFAFVVVDLLRTHGARDRLRAVGLLAIAYGVAVVMLIPIFALYMRERSTFAAAMARAPSDLYSFAARISDYVVPSPRNPLFHWVRGAFRQGLTEHSLFIGYLTIALAITGMVLLARHDTWLRSSERRVRTAFAMVVARCECLPAFPASELPNRWVCACRCLRPFSVISRQTGAFTRGSGRSSASLSSCLQRSRSALWRNAQGEPGATWARWRSRSWWWSCSRGTWGRSIPDTALRGWSGSLRIHAASWPRTRISLQGGPGLDLSFQQLSYQLIDHDPGFEIVGQSFLQARSRRQAIRSLATNLSAPLTARILATEGVRYVVVADNAYRAQGLRPPVLDPHHYSLLRRLGDVGIYAVHAARIDLEAAVETHQQEILRIQPVILPPPSVSIGAGFNAVEPFDGSTGNWMIQDGVLHIENHDVTPLRVAISAIAFSNGRPRTVRLLDRAGRVLSVVTVPAFATRVRFAPVDIGTGTTTFTLEAFPEPDVLGTSDPRQASVFFTQVAVRPVLNP